MKPVTWTRPPRLTPIPSCGSGYQRTAPVPLRGRVAARPTNNATRWLDPYVVFDGQVRVSHAFSRFDATLAVAVENLTDLPYEGIASYVMPPRHARVRLVLQSR